jgi:hypothetical protein
MHALLRMRKIANQHCRMRERIQKYFDRQDLI